ncbi:MAG: iron-containing alcohol dehydrogenase [Pleomorphochaeta sp.]
MNNFIYDIKTKVYFGTDQLNNNIGKETKVYGNKVLLTYGGGSIKKSGLYQKVIKDLEKEGLEIFELSGIKPNPRITSVRKGVELCKKENIDVLVAVGGGSVIDCTKVIAAGTYYDNDPWDIMLNKVDVKKALPLITVLTLSATGTEMNANEVITNLETNDKIGMAFEPLRPKVSFLDPSSTFSVNKYQTACGSADILNHIMEVYFNTDDGLYMLDTVMEGLMKTVIKYAPIAYNNPDNYEARANLMWASSWAINGFVAGGKTHDWTCHPIEHELSAYYDITHGLGLAIITPNWLEYTLDESTAYKFRQFGINVFNIDDSLSNMEIAKLSIKKLKKFFFEDLELTDNLTDLKIDDSKFDIMSKKACQNDKIKGFKTLYPEDVKNILKMCEK